MLLDDYSVFQVSKGGSNLSHSCSPSRVIGTGLEPVRTAPRQLRFHHTHETKCWTRSASVAPFASENVRHREPLRSGSVPSSSPRQPVPSENEVRTSWNAPDRGLDWPVRTFLLSIQKALPVHRSANLKKFELKPYKLMAVILGSLRRCGRFVRCEIHAILFLYHHFSVTRHTKARRSLDQEWPEKKPQSSEYMASILRWELGQGVERPARIFAWNIFQWSLLWYVQAN